jgi:hypothetical protein
MINSEAVPVFTEAMIPEALGWTALMLGLIAIVTAVARR